MIEPIRKRWQVAPPITPEADHNLQDYPPILRQLLFNRGHATREDAARFLEARAPEDTEPERLAGVPQAVDRICRAVRSGESIAVYGDYDADGVTATALLTHALRSLGANVQGYIPNRFDEGYGLNNEALSHLRDAGVSLVITVDCGIRSLAEAEYARKLGLDLIISDHHHPGKELPEACAVINPKQPGDTYPEKDLAGVGLAYKLACGCFSALASHRDPGGYQDLVALGTVADLAPLIGENRSLVKAGLQLINRPARQGLLSLIGAAGLRPGNISAIDIGFMLGPRLNAAGRLESALDALDLLLTDDVLKAGQLAQQLDIQNQKRQQITRLIQAQAQEMALAKDPDTQILIAVHPDFNSGVVGLAASRLTEQFYRPSVVAQQGEEFTRGSCRSIPEFHITHALDRCAHLLEHHGGHAAAAGFTVRNERLPELIECLQAMAREELAHLDLRPTLQADLALPLRDLKVEVLEYINRLQPTGYGNPQAVFVTRDLTVKHSRTVGKDHAHLKLAVTDGHITYDAIAFRQGHWQEHMPDKIDLMYVFEVNEFNGQRYLQLNVKDLKPAGTPD